jgi:prepilin-type processing-associated H-X9-DG protein
MRSHCALVAGVGAALLLAVQSGVGAPAPKKEKDEPPGPITDEQLNNATNNLKQIALAWHNYEAANGHLPSNQMDKKGKALLSWRVQILPYIEELPLYQKFKLDEPWDSENNKKLVDQMPKLFAPVRGKASAGMTFYQSFTGKNALLKPGQKVTLATILDGTSNTLLAAEAAKPVIWTKPDDLEYDGKVVPKLGGMFDGKFHAAFCDGHVLRFRKGMDADILKLLIDPADGTVLPGDVGVDTDDKK